jgi:hypothetical protein
VAGELPAAGDALGLGGRQQQRDVVAGLAVPGREHVTGSGLLQDERHAAIADARHVRGDAGPVEVHVHRDRGRRRDVGQAPLQPADLGERQARAAVLGR